MSADAGLPARSFGQALVAYQSLRLRAALGQRHGVSPAAVRKADGSDVDVSEAPIADLVRTFIEGSGDARVEAACEIAVRYCVGQLDRSSMGSVGPF